MNSATRIISESQILALIMMHTRTSSEIAYNSDINRVVYMGNCMEGWSFHGESIYKLSTCIECHARPDDLP